MASQQQTRIQILSDLHLEGARSQYDVYTITPKAPILALLGDIGLATDKDLYAFLTAQLQQFRLVFFVAGNHEAYHSTWPTVRYEMSLFEQRAAAAFAAGHNASGEFVFLDRTRWDLGPDLTVLGCTLFSRVTRGQRESVGTYLNDFYNTGGGWTTEAHNAAHEKDLGWLNEEVGRIEAREPGRRVIVLTHYSPSTDARATDPRHQGSQISSGFCSDLKGEKCFTSGLVKTWVFGHTHFNCDFVDEGSGVRLLTNQRGYVWGGKDEEIGFDEGRVITM